MKNSGITGLNFGLFRHIIFIALDSRCFIQLNIDRNRRCRLNLSDGFFAGLIFSLNNDFNIKEAGRILVYRRFIISRHLFPGFCKAGFISLLIGSFCNLTNLEIRICRNLCFGGIVQGNLVSVTCCFECS